MLPSGTIRTDRIWKRFRADRGRSLLRDEIERLQRRIKREYDGSWRWVLRDISFTAEPGDSIGLVGVNGSGKSTLLKILTRVMYPYAGTVEVAGRVGALIEVRAGIHPELTGRENVYLYGSLLGLPRREVAAKFDEIVDFAELPDSIDRQVKFFSSGMQMRLGFAVAAFLEPDVLLVDEVLAVGDSSFQQKCLARMNDVLELGTTLIFVSHDLAAVEATCEKGIWLHDGTIASAGTAGDVLADYRHSIERTAETTLRVVGLVDLVKVEVGAPDGGVISTQKGLEIRLVISSEQRQTGKIYLGISEGPSTPVFSVARDAELFGETEIRCLIDPLVLPRGRYWIWLQIGAQGRQKRLLSWQPITHFDVAGPRLDDAPPGVVRLAPVHVETTWDIDTR